MHKNPPGFKNLCSTWWQLGPLMPLRAMRNRRRTHYHDFPGYLPPGATAPDFALAEPDGSQVRLSALRGKWVVLEWGSYTCPPFRNQIASMESVAAQFGGAPVDFFLLIGREPHAGEWHYRSIAQPATPQEREELARRLRGETHIRRRMLLDDMGNTVQRLYGGLPNMLYIIDPEGRIAHHNRWADPADVAAFLTAHSVSPQPISADLRPAAARRVDAEATAHERSP